MRAHNMTSSQAHPRESFAPAGADRTDKKDNVARALQSQLLPHPSLLCRLQMTTIPTKRGHKVGIRGESRYQELAVCKQKKTFGRLLSARFCCVLPKSAPCHCVHSSSSRCATVASRCMRNSASIAPDRARARCMSCRHRICSACVALNTR